MDTLPDITLLKVSLELGLQVRRHAHIVLGTVFNILVVLKEKYIYSFAILY